MNDVPPSRAFSVSLRLVTHSKLARHSLPKRRQRLMLLVIWKGPPQRCSPRLGNQHELDSVTLLGKTLVVAWVLRLAAAWEAALLIRRYN